MLILYIHGIFFNKVEKTPKLLKRVIKLDTDVIKLAGAFALLIPSKQKINDINNVLRAVFLPEKVKTNIKIGERGL